MNYGLYLSSSGVLTNMYRQDVYANNLANTETVGFKVDYPGLRQRDPEVVEDQLGLDVSHDLLDKLGGGVLAAPTVTSFQPSEFEPTGRALDAAIETANDFFVVEKTNPDGSTDIALTRNGAFALDRDGYLVTATGGHRLLDQDNQPIQLAGAGDVTFDDVGRLVTPDGEVAGQVQVAHVDDVLQLRKAGFNLITWRGEDPRQVIEQPAVRPGHLETSAVDPIKALMDLIGATKAVTGNAEMIKYHDGLMDQAVNTLGRV